MCPSRVETNPESRFFGHHTRGDLCLLAADVNEPVHPGGLIAALIAVTVSIGAELVDRRAIGGLAILAAITGSALLLIKINVGTFFILSCSAWFALHLRHSTHARVATA